MIDAMLGAPLPAERTKTIEEKIRLYGFTSRIG
jgi:hypothetical protein